MNDSQEKIQDALNFLAAEYPDERSNSNKSVGGELGKQAYISNIEYSYTGMKDSIFHYLIYDSCVFKNVALTGSQFRNVKFQKTLLYGNSFACCDFYKVEFDGADHDIFAANNFSLSNFEECRFANVHFKNSGMLGSVFHNCQLMNTVFQSSTLEGTRFTNCNINTCDFSSVNIEFTDFSKSTFDNVFFPFYQFPFVIGAADVIQSDRNNVQFCAGEKKISINEYRNQLNNLILYYMDKHQHFPICNLYIAQGKISKATQALLSGVTTALMRHDFRMIRYFCQLALHHNMLDESTRYRIMKDLDGFLQLDDIPESRLNDYIIHIGSIRALLCSDSSNAVSLTFNIKTNVSKDDTAGVDFVNELLNDLNHNLSQIEEQNGFQAMVCNYSPYEIVINVLSLVGSVASIASLIWSVISGVQKHNKRQKLVEVDKDIYLNYIGAKTDLLKADLLRIQKQYSKRQFNQYIEEVTQSLKTDLEELYSKDIMIFKVKNDSPSDNK